MPTRASGIDKKELAFFSQQIASLLTAGIPVIDALETLEADSKPRLRAILRAVRASLGNGLNLGEITLAKHPETFDNGYLALVRSGEAAGELGPALTSLADSYARPSISPSHPAIACSTCTDSGDGSSRYLDAAGLCHAGIRRHVCAAEAVIAANHPMGAPTG